MYVAGELVDVMGIRRNFCRGGGLGTAGILQGGSYTYNKFTFNDADLICLRFYHIELIIRWGDPVTPLTYAAGAHVGVEYICIMSLMGLL